MFHHLDSTKQAIIGKCVAGITRCSRSSVDISFTDGTTLNVEVSGDCCSTSFFYEIVLPTESLGLPVLDVIEGGGWPENSDGLEDPEEVAKQKTSALDPDYAKDENDFESVSVWDIRFVTSAGAIRLRHLNDSNGYYDGYTHYSWKEAEVALSKPLIMGRAYGLS